MRNWNADYATLLQLSNLPTLASRRRYLKLCFLYQAELHIPNFSLVRRDRNRHSGGVATYIHDSVPFKTVSSHSQIELVILELSLQSRHLTCATFYRPPSSNTSVLHHFEDAIDALPPAKSNSLVLVGDFNIDASQVNSHPVLSSLQAKHDMSQVVTLPTRSSKSSQSTIDHIYTSNSLSQSHSIFSPLSSSDHSCILLSLSNVKPPSPTPSSRKMWIYQQADFEAANDELATYHPDESHSVDSAWGSWYVQQLHVCDVQDHTIQAKEARKQPPLPVTQLTQTYPQEEPPLQGSQAPLHRQSLGQIQDSEKPHYLHPPSSTFSLLHCIDIKPQISP